MNFRISVGFRFKRQGKSCQSIPEGAGHLHRPHYNRITSTCKSASDGDRGGGGPSAFGNFLTNPSLPNVKRLTLACPSTARPRAPNDTP